MNKDLQIQMTKQELLKINGGIVLEIIGIAVGYALTSAAFIYSMGKDGKSGVSNNGDN